MMNVIAKTIAQPFTLPSTYLKASLFVALSVLTPLVMHYFSLGSTVLLPLLFITFFAAFRFGWAVGLLSAIVSPLLSNALTGMPPGIILYVVLAQCVVISLLVGLFTKNSYRITIFHVLAIIVVYQLIAFSILSIFLHITISIYAIIASFP